MRRLPGEEMVPECIMGRRQATPPCLNGPELFWWHEMADNIMTDLCTSKCSHCVLGVTIVYLLLLLLALVPKCALIVLWPPQRSTADAVRCSGSSVHEANVTILMLSANSWLESYGWRGTHLSKVINESFREDLLLILLFSEETLGEQVSHACVLCTQNCIVV